jgi:NAD(P) transhydrogenase subunit beta
MTAMPQMVALFNGVGGGAVALIALVEFRTLRPASRGRPDARGADPVAVRGDHRLDLVLGLEHRVRQAAGADARPADPAAGPAVRQRALLLAIASALRASSIDRAARTHSELLFWLILVARGAARQPRSCCRSAAPTCRS